MEIRRQNIKGKKLYIEKKKRNIETYRKQIRATLRRTEIKRQTIQRGGGGRKKIENIDKQEID